MRVAGLYSGIGGLELGFQKAGFESVLLCEIDQLCRRVLYKQFRDVKVVSDIASLPTLPRVDVVTAGFPCTSWSQVGMTRGLVAGRSYIMHIIRLIQATRYKPDFIVLENVPFIIHLDEGAAIRMIVQSVVKLGYSWSYRILDTGGFGLPQRRRRWIFVAARNEEAASILFGGDKKRDESDMPAPAAHGFYWTEGTRGIGWANNAIPPLKSGSGIGIPSPPAIWNKKSGDIFIPHIRDAERLQGFPSHWSLLPGAPLSDQRARWRLLGNAVSVPISEWLARRILKTRNTVPQGDLVEASDLLPKAAYGYGRTWIAVDAVERPSRHLTPGILDFLKEDGLPLSAGATRGFRERLEDSSLRKNGQFLEALKRHEKRMERASRASRPGPRL